MMVVSVFMCCVGLVGGRLVGAHPWRLEGVGFEGLEGFSLLFSHVRVVERCVELVYDVVGDCHAGAPDGDCFADVVFVDGVAVVPLMSVPQYSPLSMMMSGPVGRLVMSGSFRVLMVGV